MDPQDHDNRTQQAVLLIALEHGPGQLSDEEIARAIGADPEDFAQVDGVRRALRDLAADGLLHHRDGFAQPTRAAVRAAALFNV